MLVAGCVQPFDIPEEPEVHESFEGYSTPTETITTDQENAVKKAKSYLRHSAFSRDRFYDQLEYEGFTAAQIEHALRIAYT